MESPTKGNIKMTRNTVLVLSAGPMEGSMLVNGNKVNNMDVGSIICQIKVKNLASG